MALEHRYALKDEAQQILGLRGAAFDKAIREYRIPKHKGRANRALYPVLRLQQAARSLREREADLPLIAAGLKKPRHDGAGEVAAKAFKLFKEQVDLPDIVIQLQIPPAEVRELFADFCALGRASQAWKNPPAVSAPAPGPAPVDPLVAMAMAPAPTVPAAPPEDGGLRDRVRERIAATLQDVVDGIHHGGVSDDADENADDGGDDSH